MTSFFQQNSQVAHHDFYFIWLLSAYATDSWVIIQILPKSIYSYFPAAEILLSKHFKVLM